MACRESRWISRHHEKALFVVFLPRSCREYGPVSLHLIVSRGEKRASFSASFLLENIVIVFVYVHVHASPSSVANDVPYTIKYNQPTKSSGRSVVWRDWDTDKGGGS